MVSSLSPKPADQFSLECAPGPLKPSMKDNESFQHASTAALRFLSYRPRSEAEVKSRLRIRFPDRIVQQVLESLKEQKLVDDEAFAILWRNSRESLNPRSASAIKRELICKGVASVIANSAVRDIDDQRNATCAGLKRARQLSQYDFTTFHNKLWGYLQRRGFSTSLIRTTITQLWEERDTNDKGY